MTLNLGLIGHGAMATEHLHALLATGVVAPHAVAGVGGDATGRFALRHGFRRHDLDPISVATDDEVDLVVIASPSERHAEQAIAAVEAGKHTIVEIPVATTLSDFDALALAASASKGRVMPAHTSRYYPALKDLFSPTTQPDPVRHFVAAMGTDKRTNKNQNGEPRDWVDDLVWHHGMHVFDVLLAALAGDEIVDVRAGGGTRHAEHGGLMDVHVLVECASGALATVALTYHATDQFTQYTFVRDAAFQTFRQGPPSSGANDLMQDVSFRDMVEEQDRAFVTSVRTGTESPITLSDVRPAACLAQRITDCIAEHDQTRGTDT